MQTAQFTFLKVPISWWGVGFYTVLMLSMGLAEPLAFWLIMAGVGAELTFVWILIPIRAFCIFYANRLGLDVQRFNRCLEHDRFLEQIESDIEEGRQSGASATPSFIVNGKIHTGTLTFEAFKQIIEANKN